MPLGVLRIDAQCLAIASNRRDGLTRVPVSFGQRAMKHGLTAVDANGLRHELDRQLRVAGLKGEQAEQVQAQRGMARLAASTWRYICSAWAKIAGVVKIDPGLKGIGNVYH